MSHSVCIWLPVPAPDMRFLCLQIPGDGGGDLRCWVSATHVGDLDSVFGSWLGAPCIWKLFGEWMSKWVFSLLLSLSPPKYTSKNFLEKLYIHLPISYCQEYLLTPYCDLKILKVAIIPNPVPATQLGHSDFRHHDCYIWSHEKSSMHSRMLENPLPWKNQSRNMDIYCIQLG